MPEPVSSIKKGFTLCLILLVAVAFSVIACGRASAPTTPAAVTQPSGTGAPVVTTPITPVLPPTTPPATPDMAVPSVGFSATDYSVPAGTSVVLVVVAIDATDAVIKGTDGSSYSLPATGGTQTVTPTSTTTYTATVTGDGGCVSAAVLITVIPPPATPVGTLVANLQQNLAGWRSWGQTGPSFADCSPSPCEGVAWSMQGGITSPSLSNDAAQFNLSGTVPYGDALFTVGIIGDNAKAMLDSDHTLLPTVHNFVYTTDVYVTNVAITQALEFDVNLDQSGIKMTWGTQCNYLGDKDWDIWDNVNAYWVSTGVPCQLVNGWNHLALNLQRDSGNNVLYTSVTLNGVQHSILANYPPYALGAIPASWWGLDLNFQMDGDSKQDPNVVYLDNTSLRYW